MSPAFEGIRRREDGPMVVPRISNPHSSEALNRHSVKSYTPPLADHNIDSVFKDFGLPDSGATAGLSIGHVSPEAANGGALALVHDGDTIEIDIPARSIRVAISDEELQARRSAMDALPPGQAWQPKGERTRVITRALKAYAAFATSADRGGFRDL